MLSQLSRKTSETISRKDGLCDFEQFRSQRKKDQQDPPRYYERKLPNEEQYSDVGLKGKVPCECNFWVNTSLFSNLWFAILDLNQQANMTRDKNYERQIGSLYISESSLLKTSTNKMSRHPENLHEVFFSGRSFPSTLSRKIDSNSNIFEVTFLSFFDYFWASRFQMLKWSLRFKTLIKLVFKEGNRV